MSCDSNPTPAWLWWVIDPAVVFVLLGALFVIGMALYELARQLRRP